MHGRVMHGRVMSCRSLAYAFEVLQRGDAADVVVEHEAAAEHDRVRRLDPADAPRSLPDHHLERPGVVALRARHNVVEAGGGAWIMGRAIHGRVIRG